MKQPTNYFNGLKKYIIEQIIIKHVSQLIHKILAKQKRIFSWQKYFYGTNFLWQKEIVYLI